MPGGPGGSKGHKERQKPVHTQPPAKEIPLSNRKRENSAVKSGPVQETLGHCSRSPAHARATALRRILASAGASSAGARPAPRGPLSAGAPGRRWAPAGGSPGPGWARVPRPPGEPEPKRPVRLRHRKDAAERLGGSGGPSNGAAAAAGGVSVWGPGSRPWVSPTSPGRGGPCSPRLCSAASRLAQTQAQAPRDRDTNPAARSGFARRPARGDSPSRGTDPARVPTSAPRGKGLLPPPPPYLRGSRPPPSPVFSFLWFLQPVSFGWLVVFRGGCFGLAWRCVWLSSCAVEGAVGARGRQAGAALLRPPTDSALAHFKMVVGRFNKTSSDEV